MEQIKTYTEQEKIISDEIARISGGGVVVENKREPRIDLRLNIDKSVSISDLIRLLL